MVKPDNYKHINDTFGHEAGIARFSLWPEALNEAAGTNDIVALYGQ